MSRATSISNIQIGYDNINYNEDLYATYIIKPLPADTIQEPKQEKEPEQEPEQYKMCGCGINTKNLCNCKDPYYQLNKLSNNLFCGGCDKWKCRCVS